MATHRRQDSILHGILGEALIMEEAKALVRRQQIRRLKTYIEQHQHDPFRAQAALTEVLAICKDGEVKDPIVSELRFNSETIEIQCMLRVQEEWEQKLHSVWFWKRRELRWQEYLWRLKRTETLKIEARNEVDDLLIEQ